MKHMLVSAAVALAVLITTATAGADGSGPFAVGAGVSGGMHFAFAAHGGASPLEPVSGHFEAFGNALPLSGGGKNPTAFHFAGPVTCLTVTGNHATLFYPIEHATPSTFQGKGVLIYLTDNGNPGPGNEPDQIGFTLTPTSTTPPSCPILPLATSNLDHGNITIHDGP